MATEIQSIPFILPQEVSSQVVPVAEFVNITSEEELEPWQESAAWQDLLSREDGVL